jgi:hypothetical protein
MNMRRIGQGLSVRVAAYVEFAIIVFQKHVCGEFPKRFVGLSKVKNVLKAVQILM